MICHAFHFSLIHHPLLVNSNDSSSLIYTSTRFLIIGLNSITIRYDLNYHVNHEYHRVYRQILTKPTQNGAYHQVHHYIYDSVYPYTHQLSFSPGRALGTNSVDTFTSSLTFDFFTILLSFLLIKSSDIGRQSSITSDGEWR